MKKLLVILLIGIAFSCSSEEPELCCTIIDSTIDIKFTDDSGRNFLESEKEFSGLTFNKIAGDWVISRDKPFIIPREDGNYLRIFANLENSEEEISQLKLQFSEEDFAIITTQIKKNGSNVSVIRVWYNEELKWEEESKTERIIEIHKS